jgi:hypothetical protein
MGTPIYEGMGGAPQQPPVPAPVNADVQDDLDARVDAIVNARLSQAEAKYQKQIDALKDQLKNAKAQVIPHLVPEHGGGPGYESLPSWGQWLQELSRDGKLTNEHLVAAGILPPPEDEDAA